MRFHVKGCLFVAFSLLFFTLNAQIEVTEDTTVNGWKKGGFLALNFNQVSLTNWAAGGESALSATALGNAFVKYRKNDVYFESVLDAGFGFITTKSDPLRKNEDKIEINAKFGEKAKGKFYYAGMLNFRTQMAPGYNFPNDSTIISRFLAPGFLSLALGMDYKPNDWFSMFISPATGRSTFVMDQRLADLGQFGVTAATYDASGNILTEGRKSRFEFGAYLRARLQKDLVKNISVVSNLQLFNNYTDPIKAQRMNIDVNWENLILIKANKWLTTSVFTNLIYDNDVQVPVKRIVNGNEVIGTGPRMQFKEVLGIGLSIKF
jgi:hypothetical protein